MLGELETHLDPDQDNCQYVDIKCPLNCKVAVPKIELEQHLIHECSLREYVCQHCNFKATYEEVVEKHLPMCGYVPLECPNRCGVSCDREMMEDHRKICRLEEVKCTFGDVGCTEQLKREEEEGHIRAYSQKHVVLMKEQFQQLLCELELKVQLQDEKAKNQEQKYEEQSKKFQDLKQSLKEQVHMVKKQNNVLQHQLREQEQKLQEKNQELQLKLQEQERELYKKNEGLKLKVKEQELKMHHILQKQEDEIGKQEKHFHDQNLKLQEQEQIIKEQTRLLLEHQQRHVAMSKKWEEFQFHEGEYKKLLKQQMRKLQATVSSNDSLLRLFQVNGIRLNWNSPPTYTEAFGYKFFIRIEPSALTRFGIRTTDAILYVVPVQGDYDDKLKWPALANFCIKVDGNAACRISGASWEKPKLAGAKDYCDGCEAIRLPVSLIPRNPFLLEITEISVY